MHPKTTKREDGYKKLHSCGAHALFGVLMRKAAGREI